MTGFYTTIRRMKGTVKLNHILKTKQFIKQKPSPDPDQLTMLFLHMIYPLGALGKLLGLG